MTNTLAYSALTQQVYWLDGKGKKHELPKGNLEQIILMFLTDGILIDEGQQAQKVFKVSGVPKWKITVERVLTNQTAPSVSGE